MTAVAACRSCGIEPLENARFCHGCGSPVAVTNSRAEYKQVTVLFADVVHSMDIAAAVGAERLREIMTELVTRASTVVQQYGGTVDKFTGDGIMALFGAPAALEDHALRACLAALGIQEETQRLAAAIQRSDDLELGLRIGLNSGEVITGEIGSSALGYTAVGEQVGMAQRMESVAPVGGVMLSDSTARLVNGAAALGEPQQVHIKGAKDPVPARQLLKVTAQRQRDDVSGSTLVGRGWELAALTAMLDRSISGHGSVVELTGPAGIGKSRLVSEVVQLAQSRGVLVVSTYCESHASNVPFRVMARLLRAVGEAGGADSQATRVRARERVPDADPQDLLLLFDLLGIADPNVELPKIDPDARRRRLTALINASQLARTYPAVFVVEDVHWIDEASESMFADFLTVMPQTPSLVLVTYRSDYRGALQGVHGAQTIALNPLTDSEASTLVGELLGSDPSVGAIGDLIAERAAGNPLFAEEITRELAERGVLGGARGDYACHADVAEIRVPATLHATIAARIDRLSPEAKHTLSAAAVIGSRFGAELLGSLGIDARVDELIEADLVDQVRFTTHSEYAFRHPLIRTVAYESQLKSDRALLHRRLALAIEALDSANHNAALIAEHYEAAGDLEVAYHWHMRVGNWALKRDIAAARLSWERAAQIADALPVDNANRAAMRIAPRSMWCGFAWRVHANISNARFEELRELCIAAGDKASLATAMAGLVMDRLYQARMHEASRLATEAMDLIESIGNSTVTVGLSLTAILVKAERGESDDVLRWSQRVIELADGDARKGNFMVGSPLALALTSRAMARYYTGRAGWRDDLEQAFATSRAINSVAYSTVVSCTYSPGIAMGVLYSDNRAVSEIEEALQAAERAGDDLALASAQLALGIALAYRPNETERRHGEKHLSEVKDVFLQRGHNLNDLPVIEVYLARESAQRGELDDAIKSMRAALDDLVREGQLLSWGIPVTNVLVETLLERGGDGDLAEAQALFERLAAAATDKPMALHDIWLLRLRTLLSRARGDEAEYVDLRDRYREMARTLEFEGHIARADALP